MWISGLGVGLKAPPPAFGFSPGKTTVSLRNGGWQDTCQEEKKNPKKPAISYPRCGH